MKLYAGILLFVVSASAAAPPYAIRGLHVDLAFADALALAEALGGDCVTGTHRRGELTYARCDYGGCDSAEQACSAARTAAPALGFADAALVRVGLEAPAPSALLTQASIVFEGNADAVAAALERQFGPPVGATPGQPGESWSNSRRVFWRAGDANLGLLMNRRTIMLTTNRVSQPADVAAP